MPFRNFRQTRIDEKYSRFGDIIICVKPASNFESWLTINLEVKNESSEKICFYRHDHLLTCLSLFCQLFRNFVCHISYCNSQQWLKNKRKDEREYCPEGAMVHFLKVKTHIFQFLRLVQIVYFITC